MRRPRDGPAEETARYGTALWGRVCCQPAVNYPFRRIHRRLATCQYNGVRTNSPEDFVWSVGAEKVVTEHGDVQLGDPRLHDFSGNVSESEVPSLVSMSQFEVVEAE